MPDKLKNPFQLKIKLLHMGIIYVGCPAFQRVVIYYSKYFLDSWAQKSGMKMIPWHLYIKKLQENSKMSLYIYLCTNWIA